MRAATQDRQRRWLAAGRWQRRVARVVRRAGMTFKQWLVLDGTAALIATTGDAVSQGDVANYLELDRVTVSRAMTALSNRGLVSRGGAMSGPAWRIVMADTGLALLRGFAAEIESLSGPC